MKAGFVQFSPEFDKMDTYIDKVLSLIEMADAKLIILPEVYGDLVNRK